MVLLRTLQEAGRSAHRSSITSIESKASFYGAIDEYNSLALIRQENDIDASAHGQGIAVMRHFGHSLVHLVSTRVSTAVPYPLPIIPKYPGRRTA